MRIRDRLQSAGNSGLCGDILKTTSEDLRNHRPFKRLEGTLSYIEEKNGVRKEEYKAEIPGYLKENYGVGYNNSDIMHWLRKPLFWDLVSLSANDFFRVTPAGRSWLGVIASDISDKKRACLNILLEQGLRVQYPNPATERVSSLVKVRPIMLLFHLFLKYESLNDIDLTCKLPYVINDSFLNNDNELDFKNLGILGERYVKFLTWDVADFIKLGAILTHETSDGTLYYLNPKYIEDVRYYYGKYNAPDIFHTSGGQQFSTNRVIAVRDITLARQVKQRDNFTDVLTGKVAEWNSAKGEPGCVAHHIIPFSRKGDYQKKYDVNTDSVEYCITVSYETHGQIHNGLLRGKEDLIIKMYDLIPEEARNKIELTREKLLKEYATATE